MNTVTEIELNGEVIELKSKRATNYASGWSVIAFTPHCSVRCTKCHRDSSLSAFTEAIISGTLQGEDITDGDFDKVRAAVLSIID